MPVPIADGTQINGTVSGKVSNGGTMVVLDGTTSTAVPIGALSSIAASYYVNTGAPPQNGDWVLTPTMGGARVVSGDRWRMTAFADGASTVIVDDDVPAPRVLIARNDVPFKS